MSREDGKIVSAYLKSLKVGGKRGRRTPEVLKRDLSSVEKKLASNPSPIVALRLHQKQIDLKQRIRSEEKVQSTTSNKRNLEESFIAIAKRYSTQNNISNTAWRKVGVPGQTLIKAGLAKPRKP